MIPLAHKDRSGLFSYSASNYLRDKVQNWIKLIFSDRNSKNLFLFLMLNVSFAFVELFYGIWANSLGLISDSFHMFFDCTGLVAGLAASVISKWRPDDKFSYGYVRAEVLAGFTNGLFLLFVAFFILKEAVERLVEPPEVNHERLLLVSVLGLLVNIIGIYAFQHGHGHSHSHSHSHVTTHHSHDNVIYSGMNSVVVGGHDHHDHDHTHHCNSDTSSHSHLMKGVFLHILADTLGSVGVIISVILMHAFGWTRADAACSIFISVLVGLSVIGLIKDSIAILMQRQPKALDYVLPQCYQKVSQLAGVYSVQEPHFWTLSTNVYVGTVKLEVSKAVDYKYLLSHTRSIFQSAGVKYLHVQIDLVSA